jgi:hypothetical protein
VSSGLWKQVFLSTRVLLENLEGEAHLLGSLRETSKTGIWEQSISLYGSSEWGTWQEGFLKATSKKALEIKHPSPWRNLERQFFSRRL